MMGYLAEKTEFSPEDLKMAMASGIVVGSFAVEDFSVYRLFKIRRQDIDARLDAYRKMLTF